MNDTKQTVVAVVAAVLLAAVSVAILWAIPAPVSDATVTACAIGSVSSGALLAIGYIVWSDWQLRKYYKPLWSPLNDSQISDVFKRYIAKNSQQATALGYVPVGVHLVKNSFGGRIEAACLLHPEGHSIIDIIHSAPILAVEIVSFLGDGSHIHSSNIATSTQDLNSYFSIFAPHGLLVKIYPMATVEELMEVHNRTVQAVLTDPNIGLRKLTVANWREHALYGSRHFDQIQFDLGKLNNAPKPFTFPAGERVNESFVNSTPEQKRQDQPTTVDSQCLETA